MNHPLRPYQIEGTKTVYDRLRHGYKRVLVVLPTGGGKTEVARQIIQHATSRGRRVYFTVDRRVLVEQTHRRLTAAGVQAGIIMADVEPTDALCQVISTDTVIRRSVTAPDVLIIDEAHGATDSRHAKLFAAWPDARVIGLTATPHTEAGVGLGSVFQVMVEMATVSELLASGDLVDVQAWGLVSPDMSQVHTRNGEYVEAEAERVVMEAVDDVVAAWKKRADGLRTLCFGQTVAHSKTLAERFVASGVTCEHIDATTPQADRDAILGRFRTGATTIVTNVGIVTKGFDVPACECVLLGCATQSVVKYLQCVGRGLRPSPGKTHCVLLDCGGNVARLGWPTLDREWSLEDTRDVAKKRTKLLADKVLSCIICYRSWNADAGPACPYCGWTKPPKKVAVKARGRETKELTRASAPVPKGSPKAVSALARWVLEGEAKGWKPVAALVRFKGRFGRWPSREEREAAGVRS